MLTNDICLEITKYLNDKDKLRFISCNATLYRLIDKIIYMDRYTLGQIMHSKHYNNFSDVVFCIEDCHLFALYGKHLYGYATPWISKPTMPKNIKIVNIQSSVQLYDGFFIEGLKEIVFNYTYNFPINFKFPMSLETIFFSKHFDCDITKCLHGNIKNIIFGSYFNQPIDGCFHEGNYSISFGSYFSQSLKNNIPKSVKLLKLRNISNVETGDIPESVLTLKLDTKNSYHLKYKKQDIQNIVPDGVRTLYVNYYNVNIPNSVKKLIIGKNYYDKCELIIPNSVINLTYSNNSKLPKLPNSIKNLYLDGEFNRTIVNVIPNGVERIEFGDNFNRKVDNCIPKSVTYIKFGRHFNNDIKSLYNRKIYIEMPAANIINLSNHY